MCKKHGLTDADLELIVYLEPLHYFTSEDFKDGTLYYSWDKHRFKRLRDEGWFEKTYERKNGIKDHDKYKISRKGKTMVNTIYKILCGEDDIPESTRRNKTMNGSSYSDKVLRTAIKKTNRDKTR